MLDCEKLTDDELTIIITGLRGINYAPFRKEERNEIIRLKEEVLDELNKRHQARLVNELEKTTRR
jgi:hypothetical protein